MRTPHRQPRETKPLFRPRPAGDFDSAGLNPAQVESLVLKFLLANGTATGRRIAETLGLTFGAFTEFLRDLKNHQIVAYSGAAAANDYTYTLTDVGRLRANLYFEECAYVGTAPVPFDEYVKAVNAQTIANEKPKEADLRRAFSDLLISEEMFTTWGPPSTRAAACSSTVIQAMAKPASRNALHAVLEPRSGSRE